VQGHVHTVAVVESEGAVHRGLAPRADRQRLGEVNLERHLHFGHIAAVEPAVSVVPLTVRQQGCGSGRLQVLFEGNLGARHGGDLVDKPCPGERRIEFFARPIRVFEGLGETEARADARIGEFFGLFELPPAAIHPAARGRDHFVGLILGQVGPVQSAAEAGGVLRVGDFLAGLLETGLGEGACFHQGAHLLEFRLGAGQLPVSSLSTGRRARNGHKRSQQPDKTHLYLL